MSDARGGVASGAAGIRSGARLDHAVCPRVHGGAVASKTVGGNGWRAAVSTAVMRSGRHFAQFTVVSVVSALFFGVIRPGWDVEEGRTRQMPTPLLLQHGHRAPLAWPPPLAGQADREAG